MTPVSDNGGLQFDITNDQQFRMYVVRSFGILNTQMSGFTSALDKAAAVVAEVPVIKQEVLDLRSDATKREYKQWIHSAAVVVGLTLKNVLTHGRF